MESVVYSLVDDPWSTESNSRNHAAPIVASDPWHTAAASGRKPVTPMPPANPWIENPPSTSHENNTGLSINTSDPWGLGITGSRTASTTAATSANTTSIDKDLGDIFGPSAGKIVLSLACQVPTFLLAAVSSSSASSYNYQQQPQQPTSLNPWNISSSSTVNFLPTANTGSISPPMSNLTLSGGHLLYPTLANGNNSSPNSASPLPSSLSAARKTPESFLGNTFSALVNLEKLVPDTRRKQ